MVPNVLRFLAALGITLSIATTAPAQQRALPPLPDETAALFPAIGRLGRAGFRERQGCTATLIAPDLIVTAAHCASKTGTSGRVFVAGWSRGDYIAARKSLREMRHPKYAPSGTHSPAHDVALIVLESPITEVTPIPLAKREADTSVGGQLALIGYHRKTPHLLSGDFACPAGPFGAGLLHVGCPVISGNSGGPVMSQTEDGAWEVVGIVSSQIGAGAIAVTLDDWLLDEITAHLAE